MKYLKNNFPVDLYKDDYDLNTAVDILIEYIGAYSKDAYNGIDKNLQEYEVYIKHIWKSLIKNKRGYVDRDYLLNIIKGLKLIDECREMHYLLKHLLDCEKYGCLCKWLYKIILFNDMIDHRKFKEISRIYHLLNWDEHTLKNVNSQIIIN